MAIISFNPPKRVSVVDVYLWGIDDQLCTLTFECGHTYTSGSERIAGLLLWDCHECTTEMFPDQASYDLAYPEGKDATEIIIDIEGLQAESDNLRRPRQLRMF
jgi:hypothetical protein